MALLVMAGLFASCQKFAEGRQRFRDLLALRDQIATEFHEKVVDVKVVNGDRMSVKFIDSPLNARSREEKQQRANAVAAFVAAHSKEPLESVSVQFASRTGAAEAYRAQLTHPPPATAGAPPSAPSSAPRR